MSRDNWDWDERKSVSFEVLKGKTLKSIENKGDELLFTTTDGELYRQVYHPDCCASCDVEEIHGDLEDLVGSPILMAEEVSSHDPDEETQAKRDKEKAEAKAKASAEGRTYYDYGEDSETWTFYKAATIKGSVTIRWYGSSNGYYSESPDFEQYVQKSSAETASK